MIDKPTVKAFSLHKTSKKINDNTKLLLCFFTNYEYVVI